MSQVKPIKPYILGELGGQMSNSGYTLNIFTDEGQRVAKDGMRICQIPAFTWRSHEAVTALGNQLRAAPVLIDALEKLCFAAQITGGTAGRDDNLLVAIDEAAKALAVAKGELHI